ncbi:MAG: hypothetical protein QXW80_02850 [Candidatus Micrarchaeia archaeon]
MSEMDVIVGSALSMTISELAKYYVSTNKPSWLPSQITPDIIETATPVVIGLIGLGLGKVTNNDTVTGIGAGGIASGIALAIKYLVSQYVTV